MEWLWSIFLICATWLVGAIPWGLVLGRILKGVDLRSYGSGATGATNSLRVLGWRISVAVFVLDFAKGLVPVVIARLIGLPDWAIAAVAVVSVVGHCWSPYIGFKGGRGMATGGGAAVGLQPWLLLLALWIIGVVYFTRYVSLASVTTAILGPIVVFVLWLTGHFPGWWVLAITAIAAIIIWQHQGNIKRLMSGTERKFGSTEAPKS